jgi:hypothetical protein
LWYESHCHPFALPVPLDDHFCGTEAPTCWSPLP